VSAVFLWQAKGGGGIFSGGTAAIPERGESDSASFCLDFLADQKTPLWLMLKSVEMPTQGRSTLLIIKLL
jgi:hypothetical protein